MQLAPGLHRLGDGLVNSYLVQDGGGITIIDAGMSGQYGDLERELAAMGRTKADIRAIVLTHGDTDHVGFADRLRQELGIPVYIHAADAPRARGEIKKPSSGWGPMKPGPFLGFMWYGLRKGGLRTKPVSELTTLDGEATLDLPGSPHVIPLPGHTPGSVAIHVPAVGALFLGDGMTTRSVLTGETGPASRPVHARPGRGARVVRCARRPGGPLGAARPRRRLDGRGGGGAAPDPRGRREGAPAARARGRLQAIRP